MSALESSLSAHEASGDVDQRPFGVSLDGQRRECRSNVFSRLINLLRVVVTNSVISERIIVKG
jgi:hypothetical protein